MELLHQMVQKLDQELRIDDYGKDSGFSRFIPAVYEPAGFEWDMFFEKKFTELFNGLMLKGGPEVSKVFLAVFPADEVLEKFIAEAKEGDLLFMHHPLVMECGDPQGKWGQGFIPVKERYLRQIKEKKLSLYTCHTPLDYHQELGTNGAMAKALNGNVIDRCLPNEFGEYLVWICEIPSKSTQMLLSELKEIFEIPYVDFEGPAAGRIEKAAIIAGCGDKVSWMEEALRKGAQAYITGEIHCHINNEYGRRRYSEMMEFATRSPIPLIGVSHAASEFLVMKTLMKDWFEANFKVETVMLRQDQWWV
ncbi:Nif3-like dinuclear metal center hexameric protein [Peribacillus kribbensis]|uniref:Nif3-like dinuclear metal center hexameric protein n=1 Tax=Peribacillus kribbensis TaxID=356658 RepID=UPI0004150940|nr:Nif3-like dinuclear metal center hexameric protein [Peribacillus kribbensis]